MLFIAFNFLFFLMHQNELKSNTTDNIDRRSCGTLDGES